MCSREMFIFIFTYSKLAWSHLFLTCALFRGVLCKTHLTKKLRLTFLKSFSVRLLLPVHADPCREVTFIQTRSVNMLNPKPP